MLLYAVAFSCMFGVVLVQMWRVSLGVKQSRTKRRPSTFAVDLVCFLYIIVFNIKRMPCSPLLLYRQKEVCLF